MKHVAYNQLERGMYLLYIKLNTFSFHLARAEDIILQHDIANETNTLRVYS